MAVMRERRDPFDVIDVYSHKILANQSKAAIRRVQRNKIIEPLDVDTFKRLSKLLEAAYDSDQKISGAQIKASSSYSLKILMQTLKAMEGMLRNAQAFRGRLDDLKQSAVELSRGNIISEDKLESLYDFCKRYAEVQQQLLKEPSIRSSFGVNVWPFASPIKYT
jgi:hypothetical protein